MGKKVINNVDRNEWKPDRYSKLFSDPSIDFWFSGGYPGDLEYTGIRDLQRYCDNCDGFHGPGECECS